MGDVRPERQPGSQEASEEEGPRIGQQRRIKKQDGAEWLRLKAKDTLGRIYWEEEAKGRTVTGNCKAEASRPMAPAVCF